MHTFFYITDILFDSVLDFFNQIFSYFSTAVTAVLIILCVVLIVTFSTKPINKKFFINNYKFLLAILITELVLCVVSTNINTVKLNLGFFVIVCIVGLIKAKNSKKKTTAKEKVDD